MYIYVCLDVDDLFVNIQSLVHSKVAANEWKALFTLKEAGKIQIYFIFIISSVKNGSGCIHKYVYVCKYLNLELLQTVVRVVLWEFVCMSASAKVPLST
jgi:hypothetical protein